ncbi:TRP-domain-containing protein [Suhomyces tanzawaensis NRRL Y-17324]|uniref:TRP-domain-containing protein n=1 Tax=Suhomyces tanzawaensis NRRL Y-17324 TaxID=984487 RepID=A0A1E4SG48_9ASCO|nr:TRP-domain-containing protein [Suhomyces tanzawaensis NRRL Y-17324]ODV78456.1 TRP-domain-containing protein [Suhomyces tanzawaensis NRRL Y-17324]
MKVSVLSVLLTALFLPFVAHARRTLSATSLVTCMENSQISPTYFNVTFNPDDRSLKYSLDLSTSLSSKVIAEVEVYAYGFMIIHKTVDLCDLGWKQFCPIFPGTMQVESIEYISKTYVDEIPGIAFSVPDIDAVVKVFVRDADTGVQLSCLQSSFSNGKTINQTGAKWATAVIAGLGLLIAAIMSTFGNSNAASHISANSVSLFLYFQSVVVVSMQHVERIPPIASSWSENLAWSMGLIRVGFMQDIFRWYVQLTGGTPTLFLKGTTRQILVQRAYNYLSELHKRATDISLKSNVNLIVMRGIKRVGYNARIESTSIVTTGFTFFFIIGYILVAVLVIFKSVVDLLVRFNKINPNKFYTFRTSFSVILKGSLLRYIYIGFTQLMIFSLWEFTQNDSPAVIVLAVLFILLALSVIGLSYYKTIQFGRRSIQQYNNPAALLYGDPRILNKYGFCYTMFHAEKYWFGIVLIGYNLLKAIFIALCQASGKASVVVLFILDLAYTIFLIWQAPYLNKPTNVLNYLISVVTTINSFLFLFFSDLFGQPAAVASIMGWVFFILNAAFSLILLILVIVFVGLSIISKNPDARFAPAKDDRFSFQQMNSAKQRQGFNEKDGHGNQELAALGIAAQDHSNNWESEMYKLNSPGIDGSNNDMLTPSMRQDDHFGDTSSGDKEVEDSEATLNHQLLQKSNGGSLGAKLKNLTRGLSMRSNKEKADVRAEAPKHKNITRLSDTLPDASSMPSPTHSHKHDSNTPINSNWEVYNEGHDVVGNGRYNEPNSHSTHNRNQSNISNMSMENGPQRAKGFI